MSQNIKTYNQFKSLGRLVKRGEKSIGRNENNECVFDISQTLSWNDLAQESECETLEAGELGEQEIQDAAKYRKYLKTRVLAAAENGDKTCAAYLSLLQSHPLASFIDECEDYSSDSSDLEPVF